jgi:hypothetical protein
MKRTSAEISLALGLALLAVGCGGGNDAAMMGPSPVGTGQTGATFMSVTYVFHLGGGMMTQAGQPLDYTRYGPMMGGQWIMGGMMGNSHAGGSWGMMGPAWRNANGSYGMVFGFTTS